MSFHADRKGNINRRTDETIHPFFLFVLAAAALYGIEGTRVDLATLAKKAAEIIEIDDNKDGKPEYRVMLDSKAQKIEEALDTNGDGELDDFSYYKNGVLYLRELDTNYDGTIDTWVYIKEGIYVERYERDTDYDGKIDLVKEFGKQPSSSGVVRLK